MKIVKYKDEYKLLDSKNRVAETYMPIVKLEDIFLRANGWKKGTSEVIEDYECTDIIVGAKGWQIGKFKALKHEVAAYLIKNKIEANIPRAYIDAHATNSHLYTGRYLANLGE